MILFVLVIVVENVLTCVYYSLFLTPQSTHLETMSKYKLQTAGFVKTKDADRTIHTFFFFFLPVKVKGSWCLSIAVTVFELGGHPGHVTSPS